jgi:hypothetical protein
MRFVGVLLAMLLICGASLSAQDRSLGDVARESRAPKAPSAKAKKVLTDEDSITKPISDGDEPTEVVTNAFLALARNTSHRCVEEASGNSGPGWSKTSITEIAGPDRTHVISDEIRPAPRHQEWIWIGDDLFLKEENSPWRKIRNPQMHNYLLPKDVRAPAKADLNQQYNGWDTRLVGREVLGGVPVMQYRFSVHTDDFEKIVTTFVGVNDGLPYKTETWTSSRLGTTPPITWHDSTSCAFGVGIRIEPPVE